MCVCVLVIQNIITEQTKVAKVFRVDPYHATLFAQNCMSDNKRHFIFNDCWIANHHENHCMELLSIKFVIRYEAILRMDHRFSGIFVKFLANG